MIIMLFSQIKTYIDRFATLALPVRFAFSALITLAAGTGLGFFAEYAAYSWAIYYGMRPPLEGIPYLKVAVTGLTVFLFLCGSIVYITVLTLAGLLLRQLQSATNGMKLVEKLIPGSSKSGSHDQAIRLFQAAPLKIAFIFASLMATVIFGLMLIIDAYEIANIEQPVMVSLPILIFFAAVLLWSSGARIWMGLIAVAVFTMITTFGFFHVDAYSQLLRSLGYGGGLPITIVIAENSSSVESQKRLHGYLMLRTTTSLMLYEPEANRIREIPLQHILYFDNNAAPTRRSPPYLPPVPPLFP